MTVEQAEANWGWDPDKGSIPFKRPRLTAKNIRDQRRLARPGTLNHWMACESHKDICTRFNSGKDALPIIGGKPGQTSNLGCLHIENVNCLRCRKVYYSRRAAR